MNFYIQRMNAKWQQEAIEAAQKAQDEEFANYCERDLQNAQTHQDQDDEWIERENS